MKDTAIVVGVGEVAGTLGGEKFSHTETWTSTYVKVNGKWQCNACHVSKPE